MHWKTTTLLLSALVLAGSSFGAIAGDEKKAAAKGQKALQGLWTAKKDDETFKMTFDGNKFKLEFKGESASGTYTLDPSKEPKTMDLLIVKGSGDNTQKFEGKTSKAIYHVDAKKLKWLANQPGRDERPEAFPKEGEGPKGLYLEFERAKK